MHIRIEDDPVVYGDLRGDGTTIAFVSINTGADSDTIEDIYAYEEDARCKPRLLLKTGGMPEEGGKIVGKSYVFVRFNLQKNQEERVEVRAVGARIVEAKVTPVSPS